MTEPTDELKPCPFPHAVKRGVFLEVDTEDFGFVRGACSDCGCAGPYIAIANLDRPAKSEKAEAIAAWNTRTADTRADDVVGELREELADARNTIILMANNGVDFSRHERGIKAATKIDAALSRAALAEQETGNG